MASAYKTYIQKVQTKKNHAIRQIFFARAFGEKTDSAVPLINLLELLKVNNVCHLHALRFTQLWYRNLLPNIFHDFIQEASSLHTYNARYTASENNYSKTARFIYSPGSTLTIFIS